MYAACPNTTALKLFTTIELPPNNSPDLLTHFQVSVNTRDSQDISYHSYHYVNLVSLRSFIKTYFHLNLCLVLQRKCVKSRPFRHESLHTLTIQIIATSSAQCRVYRYLPHGNCSLFHLVVPRFALFRQRRLLQPTYY